MLLEFKTILFALITGILPTIIWLLFWLEEDRRRPEPQGMITRAFIAGGIAVVIAFYLEQLTVGLFGPLQGISIDLNFSIATFKLIAVEIPLFLVWSFIEELAKFAIAYLLIFHNKNFDEPIDAMIYMITVALGFAAVENSLFLIDALYKGESEAYFLLTGHVRFLGATVLHLVSSAILGAALALAFYGSKLSKFFAIIGGLILATLLHALFNFFIIINDGTHIFRVLLVLWIGALFVMYLFERVKCVVNGNFVNVFLKTRTTLYAKR